MPSSEQLGMNNGGVDQQQQSRSLTNHILDVISNPLPPVTSTTVLHGLDVAIAAGVTRALRDAIDTKNDELNLKCAALNLQCAKLNEENVKLKQDVEKLKKEVKDVEKLKKELKDIKKENKQMKLHIERLTNDKGMENEKSLDKTQEMPKKEVRFNEEPEKKGLQKKSDRREVKKLYNSSASKGLQKETKANKKQSKRKSLDLEIIKNPVFTVTQTENKSLKNEEVKKNTNDQNRDDSSSLKTDESG